jgi:RimJ/RimL family protein N-acetyltransferase
MDEVPNLLGFKQPTFEAALQNSIPVNQELNLVPIGSWVLNEKDMIAEFAAWRFESSDNFFARFPYSPESFRDYLTHHAIQPEDSLLFVLIDSARSVHGHVGLNKVHQGSGEIDAVMIGQGRRGQGLTKMSLESLMGWGGSRLGIFKYGLEVLSSNLEAIRLYRSLNFIVINSINLKWIESEGASSLNECSSAEANTDLMKLIMRREQIALPGNS